MADRELLEIVSRALTVKLANEGRLCEGGFQAMRHILLPKDSTAAEIEQAKVIFMAGAQHIYAGMMAAMDSGEMPTAADMRRMQLLDAEMMAFEDKMRALLIERGGGQA